MAILSPYLAISLNVNGLNSLIKKQRVAEWILKKPIQVEAACKGLTLALRTHMG